MMTILPETAFFALPPDNAEGLVAVVKLAGGTLLIVREDGTALGTDGQTYAHVSREIADDEYEELGWTTDARAPLTLAAKECPSRPCVSAL